MFRKPFHIQKQPIGRPRHEVTATTRSLVLVASSDGKRQHDIAALLGITARTMRRWYRRELQNGMAAATKAGISPYRHRVRLAPAAQA